MYYQNQIHEKFLRSDTHNSSHLKKSFVRLQLGSYSSVAAIFFKTDCFGSSSNITFLANIVYCFGSIVEDVAQCCGLVVQGYNITFDCSFLNSCRLLEDGWQGA